MKQIHDSAIVLSRIDYGERDRILTLLCREHGKRSALAKGVRSQKSRLAGGIELLSESEVGLIQGKGSLTTLTSARLKVHFANLVTDVKRMQRAFAYLKAIGQVADEEAGQEYYELLLVALTSLNDLSNDIRMIDLWFNLQLLTISGSAPSLLLEVADDASQFEFEFDSQCFVQRNNGPFGRNDLKVLRLCATQPRPPRLQTALGSEDRLVTLVQAITKMNLTEL